MVYARIMLKRLGEELAKAREQQGRSLQSVAEPANITAPYLQKLERGVVQTPSPRVLARLARALGIPYLRLLELAGYLDEDQLAEAQSRAHRPHPLVDQELAPDEWRAVGVFIHELKSRRGKPRPSASSKQARPGR
jgi:transcriptional regulator with XRE-family HTH domain